MRTGTQEREKMKNKAYNGRGMAREKRYLASHAGDFASLVKRHKDENGKTVVDDTTQADALRDNARKAFLTMTPAQKIRNRVRGRNQACYCGSGKKLKNCCGVGL